jgi:hypothetical protein
MEVEGVVVIKRSVMAWYNKAKEKTRSAHVHNVF